MTTGELLTKLQGEEPLTREERDALLALTMMEVSGALLREALQLRAGVGLVVMRREDDTPTALLLAMPNPEEHVVQAVEHITDEDWDGESLPERT